MEYGIRSKEYGKNTPSLKLRCVKDQGIRSIEYRVRMMHTFVKLRCVKENRYFLFGVVLFSIRYFLQGLHQRL